jgi:hypothetical protein
MPSLGDCGIEASVLDVSHVNLLYPRYLDLLLAHTHRAEQLVQLVEGLLETQLRPNPDPILLVLMLGDLLSNLLIELRMLLWVPLHVLRVSVVSRFPLYRLFKSRSLVALELRVGFHRVGPLPCLLLLI